MGGKPLTGKQKGFFGARAGGAPEKPAPTQSPGEKRPAVTDEDDELLPPCEHEETPSRRAG